MKRSIHFFCHWAGRAATGLTNYQYLRTKTRKWINVDKGGKELYMLILGNLFLTDGLLDVCTHDNIKMGISGFILHIYRTLFKVTDLGEYIYVFARWKHLVEIKSCRGVRWMLGELLESLWLIVKDHLANRCSLGSMLRSVSPCEYQFHQINCKLSAVLLAYRFIFSQRSDENPCISKTNSIPLNLSAEPRRDRCVMSALDRRYLNIACVVALCSTTVTLGQKVK